VQAHVVRLLRVRMDKPNVKAGKAVASVTLSELLAAFEGMSIAAAPDQMVGMLQQE
jgi:hypothetical protein